MSKLFIVFALFLSSLAHADGGRFGPPGGPGGPGGQGGEGWRIQRLEENVMNMNRALEQMERRLRFLEGNGPVLPPPPPPNFTNVSCILVDTGYSKTFLGQAKSQLQAETMAREVCGQGVNPTYCSGAVRCSTGVVEPGVQGYFCAVRDSGYSKTFQGEGLDIIVAEAKAKQACQAAVNANYCGNVKANCEATRF